MFASMHGADPLPGSLARMGIPVVCSGRPLGRVRVDVPYVDVDHDRRRGRGGRHLLDTGRQRIATIAGPQDMVGRHRPADRLPAGAARGSSRRSIVAVGDFTRESGAVAMRQLLDDDPKLDAVFVASDLMAHGALRALREAGRRVPDDVAVVGFDDIEIGPLHRAAADHGAPADPARSAGSWPASCSSWSRREDVDPVVLLPTELVIRESA